MNPISDSLLLGAWSDWGPYILGPLLFLTSLFLIILILLQRGKGGGLAGAFGGMGGQSAFGAKAGDQIMWTTVVVSGIWIVLCMVTLKSLGQPTGEFDEVLYPAGGAVSAGETGGVEDEEEETTEAEGEEGAETVPAAEGEAVDTDQAE